MLKFIKKILFENYHRPRQKYYIFLFFKKFLFNKNTNIFSERILLLKSPPNSMIYYNSIGRIINLFLNNIYFLNKFFEKEAGIDVKKNYKDVINKGNDNIPWLSIAIHHFENYNKNIPDNFFIKNTKDYFENVKLILGQEKFKDSEWWENAEKSSNRYFLMEKILTKKNWIILETILLQALKS